MIFLIIICSLLFSCASTNSALSEWHSATNLSELEGTWISSQGEYTYPFIIDGKKYLRYSWNKTDDTHLWQEYAEKNKMKLEDLWEKRFALATYVYSSDFTKEKLPDSDVNGVQTGRKYTLEEGKIYSTVEYLIPERLVSINLSYFSMSADLNSFMENEVFHFASDKFPDMTSDYTVYYKAGEVSE